MAAPCSSLVPAATERLDGSLRFPSFEDVDPRRVDNVSRQREVEAAGGAAGLPHHGDTPRQIVVALCRVDDHVTRDNHHKRPPSVYGETVR